jgi:hypothetical protein
MLCHFGIILPTIIDVGQWGSLFIHPEHLLLCYVMLIKNPLLLHLSPFFLVPPWTSSRTLVPITWRNPFWPSSWSWMTSESLGEGGFNPARMSWWGAMFLSPKPTAVTALNTYLRIDHENAHKAHHHLRLWLSATVEPQVSDDGEISICQVSRSSQQENPLVN